MKTDSLNVYERPVAEEVNLTVEYPIAQESGGSFEIIDDPGTETQI